jgi:hypothetical protein
VRSKEASLHLLLTLTLRLSLGLVAGGAMRVFAPSGSPSSTAAIIRRCCRHGGGLRPLTGTAARRLA